jgi:hypothetical protein
LWAKVEYGNVMERPGDDRGVTSCQRMLEDVVPIDVKELD